MSTRFVIKDASKESTNTFIIWDTKLNNQIGKTYSSITEVQKKVNELNAKEDKNTK